MKVRFTDSIKNSILIAREYFIYYPKNFGHVNFFEVVNHHSNLDFYTIKAPKEIEGMVIYKRHVVPYNPISLDLDEIFEWVE